CFPPFVAQTNFPSRHWVQTAAAVPPLKHQAENKSIALSSRLCPPLYLSHFSTALPAHGQPITACHSATLHLRGRLLQFQSGGVSALFLVGQAASAYLQFGVLYATTSVDYPGAVTAAGIVPGAAADTDRSGGHGNT